MGVILFIVITAIVFLLGFILIKKLDSFLNSFPEYKEAKDDTDIKKPSCIMLNPDSSEDEILKEIHNYKLDHKNIRIIICDDTVNNRENSNISNNNSFEK